VLLLLPGRKCNIGQTHGEQPFQAIDKEIQPSLLYRINQRDTFIILLDYLAISFAGGILVTYCGSKCPHCNGGICTLTEDHCKKDGKTYHVCPSCKKHWVV
jgi:hypothetical protein